MGCYYDVVKYHCPWCSKLIEQQSKSGACLLETFELHKAPISLFVGLNMEHDCEHCGKPHAIRMHAVSVIPMPTVSDLRYASDPRLADSARDEADVEVYDPDFDESELE